MPASPQSTPPWRLAAAATVALCLAGTWYVWRPTPPSTAPASRAAPGTPADPLAATVGRLVEQLGRGDADAPDGAVAALAALGPAAVPALVKALEDPDEERRIRIIQLLARLGPPAPVAPLVDMLTDQRAAVRLEAVLALGALGDRAAAPALAAQYGRDDDPQVRYECLTSLGRIGDPASTELLAAATADADLYARMWAIDALCLMNAAPAPAAALRLLDDPSPYVRRRVLRTCGAALASPAGDQAVVSHAVHDTDFETTVWARRLIVQRLADASAREAIAGSIRETTAPLIATSGAASAEQAPAVFLRAELRDGTVVEQLIATVRAPDLLLRQHAVFLLGQSGDERAIPALSAALADPVPLVATTAREGLQHFAAAGNAAARAALATPGS